MRWDNTEDYRYSRNQACYVLIKRKSNAECEFDFSKLESVMPKHKLHSFADSLFFPDQKRESSWILSEQVHIFYHTFLSLLLLLFYHFKLDVYIYD